MRFSGVQSKLRLSYRTLRQIVIKDSTNKFRKQHTQGLVVLKGTLSYSHTTPGVSYTSLLTNMHSGQDSGSVPDPPPSSSQIMATNSTMALTGDEENETSRAPPTNYDYDTELPVLDPEHPLIKRFQSVLKAKLTKQLEELNLQIKEKLMEEQQENTRAEKLGVEIYSAQQDLARVQMALESQNEILAEATAERKRAEVRLVDIKDQHRLVASQLKKDRTQVSDLQVEVDKLNRDLHYMEEVTSNLRSDVKVMKNTTQKAKAERRQAEEQKIQQDLYVDRLTKQEKKLREQVALIDVQMCAQTEESRAIREALSEAQIEMDSLKLERKQLLHQWNSSLVRMKQRDEAYTALQEALSSADREVRNLKGEVEGYRRSILQEQERHQKLTVPLKRAENNATVYENLILHSRENQEALKAVYSTHTRTLHETEKSLERVNVDISVRQSELVILKRQLEKELSLQVELKEKIVRKMQEQLTHDNTAKHTRHIMDKTMAHQRDKESQLLKLEKELALVELDISESSLNCKALAQQQLQLEQEVIQRQQLLSTNEAAAAKHILTIQNNQNTINNYNKKIEQIIAKTGTTDLAPLEIKAKALTKELAVLEAEIKQQQQLWLWQQNELMKLSQEKEKQSSATLEMTTQLTVLQQRKLRTESEIKQEQRSLSDLNRHSEALRLDMQKLNSLISKNTEIRHALKQSNILMEKDFIHTLKNAERKSIEMQLHLEKVKEEIARKKNSLVEAERQIMLWEKKTQLVREIRSAVDVGKDDVHTMKAEIHRMEVHYAALLKQQEKMLRDLDAVVDRRENIIKRGEAQTRVDRKHTTQYNLQLSLQSLRRNIRQTHKQADECDEVIAQLQQKKALLSDHLKQKQQQIIDLQQAGRTMLNEVEELEETKERNQIQLLILQSRVKRLQAVKEGRYRPVVKDETELQLAMDKELKQMQLVSSILPQMEEDFPQLRNALRSIALNISVHMST